MSRSVSASSCSFRRSRRPQTTPRDFVHENRETSEMPAVAVNCRMAEEGLGRTARGVRLPGVTPRHSTDEAFEQRRNIVSGECGGKAAGSRRILSPLDTYPTQSGTARVPRMGECADRLCSAAIHPREEPCGGHRATGGPTAIDGMRPENQIAGGIAWAARRFLAPCHTRLEPANLEL